jgi:hypothetical protein
MKTPPKNTTVAYGLMIGLYWLTFNSMLSFANMLYKAHNFSNYQIGLAGTCTAISNVIAQPTWA